MYFLNLKESYNSAVEHELSLELSIPHPAAEPPQPYLQSQFTAWVYLLGRKFPIRGGLWGERS